MGAVISLPYYIVNDYINFYHSKNQIVLQGNMKLDRLETHDRYEHFTKQAFDIGECCQDIINQRPFGNRPFYIFAHARTDDDGVSKRLIWQPRLSKPTAQTNSMLFKAYPGTDKIKIIWMIPERMMWSQFKKGLICESTIVEQSIHDFQHNRDKLEAKDSDDLGDLEIASIYEEISRSSKRPKLETLVASVTSLETTSH
jgi:hypothetical protein